MEKSDVKDAPAGYAGRSKTALVCEDNQDLQKTVISALKEMQYEADIAANADEAIEKIRFNQYDVIVLNEIFSGKTPEDNEVLRYLQEMPMATRRHIFLALTGKDLPTQDNMKAFEKSANVVINEKDVSGLKNVLQRAIPDNEQFYKVYKESLIKLGKT